MGLGFALFGLGFEVFGLGFKVFGAVVWVSGLGFEVLRLGFEVFGLGFEVLVPKSREAASKLRSLATLWGGAWRLGWLGFDETPQNYGA